MTSYDGLLARLRRRLADAGIATAALDARLLLEAASGLDRTRLLTDGDRPAPDAVITGADALADRRAGGEPVGRILGRRDFRGLSFALGPETLEPRPDTETLVEVALAAVRGGRLPGVAADGSGLRFADIGTGTGAIAVALLHELPGARGLATDIAAGALEAAARNAAAAGVAARLDLALGSYLDPLDGGFALIVSNPPYIPSAEIDGLAREVRLHDPRRALDGGADGLDAYRVLSSGAARHLVADGLLALEIGHDQAPAVRALLDGDGWRQVERHLDLAGRDRVVAARAPAARQVRP